MYLLALSLYRQCRARCGSAFNHFPDDGAPTASHLYDSVCVCVHVFERYTDAHTHAHFAERQRDGEGASH